MKKLICVVAVFLFALSPYTWASDTTGMFSDEGAQTSKGMYCNVESAEVCVVARTEEDCTKLEGKKVDSCPAPESKEK